MVVEDERKVASFLKKGLTENGYSVDVAHSGEDAKSFAADNDYDLLILDIMLPDTDGLAVARYCRATSYKGPILMLTALNTTKDKVQGLDAGADDYLAKPFAFEELLARVRALLRRYGDGTHSVELKYEDLHMDLVKRKVVRSSREITLTTKEFALLEYFLRNCERPVSRTELLEHVWDMGFDPGSNVVDVYVNMLRKKLDASGDSKLIHTVVGFGYVLKRD